MKILIVDDEPIILNSLKDMILHSEYSDFTIFTADNAMDAYELLQKESPQIMLCDIQMPCENGIDLLKKYMKTSQLTLLSYLLPVTRISAMHSLPCGIRPLTTF